MLFENFEFFYLNIHVARKVDHRPHVLICFSCLRSHLCDLFFVLLVYINVIINKYSNNVYVFPLRQNKCKQLIGLSWWEFHRHRFTKTEEHSDWCAQANHMKLFHEFCSFFTALTLKQRALGGRSLGYVSLCVFLKSTRLSEFYKLSLTLPSLVRVLNTSIERSCVCLSLYLPSSSSNMAAIKTLYDISAKLLTGELLNFSSLKGKVILIENVASLWGTTTRDYTQMNELHDRYSSKGLVVLGVPCNQFGHQVGYFNNIWWLSFIHRSAPFLNVIMLKLSGVKDEICWLYCSHCFRWFLTYALVFHTNVKEVT